ncbi:MAG: carboxylating nicotinate-nucleotide diphosphorylase [Anaerolinea sp.]|nr:carboxylating nicotinate-nucleotide diphosphorylase [Anaerolinea sp.]
MQTAIQTLIALALQEDLGAAGDVTSAASLPADKIITGRVIAKEAGVLAGLNAFEQVYRQLDPAVHFRAHIQNGDPVQVGALVCEVTGAGHSVLSGERVALNFLQHLSGIASLTAKFVAAVKGTQAIILDTRKTTPGWRLLEKYAVRMGGGHNHRMGLYDMVLIKDNHIDAAGGITNAVNLMRAHDAAKTLPVEVEVRTLDELCEALTLGVQRILLDNMTLAQMRQAVTITAGHVPLEASGNMSLERVAAVAATGVNYISVGALTHSAPALDLSMKLSR